VIATLLVNTLKKLNPQPPAALKDKDIETYREMLENE
jgi:hypothetical protein